MIQLKKDIDCCGCTACASICSHEAITMKEDSLGFLHPHIDSSKCINCGLCEKVCQFNPTYSRFKNYDVSKVYLARIKSNNQLRKSQSGGLFYAIAIKFIQNGGIVYGAAFNDKWHVSHQRVDNSTDLEKLRMSKYVQSDMRGIMPYVKKDLSQDKTVLFSGTPCQISGLKSFIPERLHANLFCIDIVCHCVPSPKIWSDYIKYLENKRRKQLIAVQFRDKRFGWHGARESFLYNDGTLEFRRTNNTLFSKLLSIRRSCTNCPYTNLRRVGDITLGDFWGLPKNSKYEDNKGVSLVLINSEKGESVLDDIKETCIIIPGDNYDYKQSQLREPVKINPLRSQFLEDYTTKGFKYIAYRYSDCGWRYKKDRFISSIKTLLKKALIQ